MTRPTLLVACLASALAAATNEAVPRFTDPERRARLEKAFPQIDAAMARYQTERHVPGLAYGVVIDGELRFVKALGVAELDRNTPVSPETVFRIASMTKSFTAMAILRLRDDGKLSLDDPASKWIPQLARMPRATADQPAITVRHLLTHAAGFPEDNPWGDRQLGISDATLDKWLAAGIPWSTPTGTAFEYSNYGFALLGRIVEKASGLPYADYVRRTILQPLGMTSTTFERSQVEPARLALGYTWIGKYLPEPLLPHGTFGAMGGLLTSARDLSRYVALFLSAYPPRDDADRGPLRRSTLREMQEVARLSGPPGTRLTGYGYGLSVQQDCTFGQMVGHGGGLPGFGSYMLWLPQHGVGLIALANRTYASPRPALEESLRALHQTGALEPRRLAPSAVLITTQKRIYDLWKDPDEDRLGALAAGNLALDRPFERRVVEMRQLRQEVGECDEATPVQPENLLRGHFDVSCRRGTVRVTFNLAPTQPPLVQHLEFAKVDPRVTPSGPCGR